MGWKYLDLGFRRTFYFIIGHTPPQQSGLSVQLTRIARVLWFIHPEDGNRM